MTPPDRQMEVQEPERQYAGAVLNGTYMIPTGPPHQDWRDQFVEVVPRSVAEGLRAEVEKLRRELHRTAHRSFVVKFEDCRMCAELAERLGLSAEGPS